MSFDQHLGLTVKLGPNLWSGAGMTKDITAQVGGLGFEKAALLGYKAAGFSLGGSKDTIEEWISEGLGRDITIYNEGGEIVWNGFVNSYVAQMGILSMTIGPFMQITNRDRVVYSTVDTSVTPPAVGVRTSTQIYNNLFSQSQYGIQGQTLSIGGAIALNADRVANAYLAEFCMPQSSANLSLGGRGNVGNVSVSCLGYGILLDSYSYNYLTSGTVSITTKIQQVLAAAYNVIYSTDYTGLEANTSLVSQYENDDRTAMDIIMDLVAKSNAAFERFTFGFYQNRKAYYASVPHTQLYTMALTDPAQKVFHYTGGFEIFPWNVEPAQWLRLSDYLTGRTPTTAYLRDDPRNVFIESVRYAAPFGLAINGGKIHTFDQILGQAGLKGAGV